MPAKTCALLLLFPLAAASQERSQLPNLATVSVKNRVPVGPPSWPAKPGEAEVCLWKDDKIAALSITIDDNTAPDVEEWIKRAKPLEFPLTWFIISGHVGTGVYWGTWESWQKVLDTGYDVQSHTVTHLGNIGEGWAGIDWEYDQSQKDIQAHLKDHEVHFLAYPGGKNAVANDPAVAAKYYMAARGTTGTINPPGRIWYLNVNAMSGATLDKPEVPYSYVPNILDPKSQFYRGWAVILFHKVNEWSKAQAFLDFYAAHKEDVWACTFGDGATYGQERDTAKLTLVENSEDKIRLALSDDMDDKLFNAPLTLKVRVPDKWRTIVARQGEKPIPVQLLEHEGGRFAIVEAAPDAGEISVENGFE